MPTDPRGRWFRVYARQVLQHPKFKDLSHAELGAWMDLRASVDLMDGAPLADRTEAMLRLRRRTRSTAKLLDRLIEVRLLDVLDDGRIGIHDLEEHHRRNPSDDPERVKERVTKHREKVTGNDYVTALHANRNAVTKTPVTTSRAREENREEENREEAEQTARAKLPDKDDPLTIICELLMTAAPIEDREYRKKVDEQTRRYGAEWVVAAYRQAFSDCLADETRPQRWTLSRFAEVHLAAWTRAEELRQIEAQHEREQAEREQIASSVAQVTPEEVERQSLIRRAVGLWIRGGRRGEVPTDGDAEQLRQWIAQNEGTAA